MTTIFMIMVQGPHPIYLQIVSIVVVLCQWLVAYWVKNKGFNIWLNWFIYFIYIHILRCPLWLFTGSHSKLGWRYMKVTMMCLKGCSLHCCKYIWLEPGGYIKITLICFSIDHVAWERPRLHAISMHGMRSWLVPFVRSRRLIQEASHAIMCFLSISEPPVIFQRTVISLCCVHSWSIQSVPWRIDLVYRCSSLIIDASTLIPWRDSDWLKWPLLPSPAIVHATKAHFGLFVAILAKKKWHSRFEEQDLTITYAI